MNLKKIVKWVLIIFVLMIIIGALGEDNEKSDSVSNSTIPPVTVTNVNNTPTPSEPTKTNPVIPAKEPEPSKNEVVEDTKKAEHTQAPAEEPIKTEQVTSVEESKQQESSVVDGTAMNGQLLKKQIEDELTFDVNNLEVTNYEATKHIDVRFEVEDNQISGDNVRKQIIKNTADILYVISENSGDADTVTVSTRLDRDGTILKLFQATGNIQSIKNMNWESYRKDTTENIENKFPQAFTEIFWSKIFDN